MLIRNVTKEDLEKALDAVNVKYNNNITWRNFQYEGPSRGGGNTYRVTLKTKDARGPGGAKGISRMIWGTGPEFTGSACWHVHGNFFASLFGINPKATIRSRNKTIDESGGNWEDFNIGSQMSPVYASEACECYERGLD